MIFRILALPAMAALGLVTTEAEAQEPQPEDFVDYEEVTAVEVAPHGHQAFVQTRRADPGANGNEDSAWLVHMDGSAPPERLELPDGARSVRWHPDGRRLTLVAPTDHGPQVHTGSPNDEPDDFEVLTDASGGVNAYEMAPDGKALVYTRAVAIEPAGTPDAEAGEPTRTPDAEAGGTPDGGDDAADRRGVEVDVESFSIMELMAGGLEQHGRIPRQRAELWLQSGAPEAAQRISGDRSVTGFAFSPDGERLGLTAKKDAPRPYGLPAQGTDLLAYHLDAGQLETLREGRDGVDDSGYEGRVSHSSPIWSPSGGRLGFRVTDHTQRMASVTEFGIHHMDQEESRIVVSADETELHAHGLHWDRSDRILVERTERAHRGLWELSVPDGALEPIRAFEGRHSDFDFSADGDRAAWVQQRVGTPPEVYAGDPFQGQAEPVTRFNEAQAELSLPEAREVGWTSEDGTDVSGWLLEPNGADASDPAPLVVFLAGGPTFVVSDAYRPYPRGTWPMPLTLLAHRGYAVLVVHYRGTGSFGPDFRHVAVGEEDVADIHTGIAEVGHRPEIDGERLGILGHSHGAWIGPLAAGGGPAFQAASFAEGTANFLGNYSAMPGFLNVGLHEEALGASPWEDLDAYLELSPDLQAPLIERTPTLLEAGEEAAALQAHMLGKAFWRHDTPHQVVIYPETGHNIREPQVMVESMERTLEWFESWLPR